MVARILTRRISRGGSTTKLTEDQERQSIDLANAALRKRSTPNVFGRDLVVRQRTGFLFAQARRQSALQQLAEFKSLKLRAQRESIVAVRERELKQSLPQFRKEVAKIPRQQIKEIVAGRRILPSVRQAALQRKALVSERPVVTVERVPTPKTRSERELRKSQQKIQELKIEIQRAPKEEKFKLKRELKIAEESAKAFAFGTFIAIKEIPSIPKRLLGLARDPSQLRNIPGNIKRGGEKFGKELRISPTQSLIQVGGIILVTKGVGKGLQVTGKLSSKAATIASPSFRRIKESKIIIPSGQTGKTITLEVAGPVSKIKIPLKEQVKLAGKEITAVSAQADRLVNLIKTKRVVRKPIPGEEKLSIVTKRLLDKFDRGRITRRQLIDLDNSIRIETKGQGSLLERSLFASPGKKARISRLGQEPTEATLKDILAGDVTFRTQKPQILVFEDIKVQKFPKELKDIEKKLKTGKTLTKSEANRLLQFQLKKSGDFKPIGALTREPEITLAPGEIVKKGKKLAVTLVNGRRVEIVSVKVVKAKPETARLLKKAEAGTIKTKELKKLRKNLKKETGFRASITRDRISRKRVSVKRKLISGVSRLKKPKKRIDRKITDLRATARKVIGRPTPTPRPTRGPPQRIRAPPRRPPTAPPRGPPRRPPRRPPIGPPLKPIIKPSKRKRRKKVPGARQGFDVEGKSKKKFIKINRKPLSKKDAKNRLAFALDNTTSKTGKIIPKGKIKKLDTVTKREKGFFRKNKRKFREFRIKKGKKIKTPNKFIERRRFGIDTKGEKKQLALARFARQQGFIGKRKVSQREVMLKNLAKARAVRATNLRRKKK